MSVVDPRKPTERVADHPRVADAVTSTVIQRYGLWRLARTWCGIVRKRVGDLTMWKRYQSLIPVPSQIERRHTVSPPPSPAFHVGCRMSNVPRSRRGSLTEGKRGGHVS